MTIPGTRQRDSLGIAMTLLPKVNQYRRVDTESIAESIAENIAYATRALSW